MTRSRSISILLGTALAVAVGCSVLAWSRADPVFQRKIEMLDVVVRVETADGWGSGTVIHSGDDGVYILTNHHVLPEASTLDKGIKVQSWIYEDASGPALPLSQSVEVVADDADKDLALLRVSDPEWRTRHVAAVIGPRDKVEPTEDVFVVGAGLGKRVYATEGMVSLSWVEQQQPNGPAIEMLSAPMIFGNSGGAAFVSRHGRYVLAGVPEAIEPVPFAGVLHPIPHMGYAITMGEVRAFLLRNGRAGLIDHHGIGPRN